MESVQLTAAVANAFPRYLWERINKLGVVAGSSVDAAIAAGVAELEETLADLLARPEVEQSRSPLELVRHATRHVTEALAGLGVQRPTRDQFLAETYPEDLYDLYPASSQSLGEEVWRLHLEWGKAKAASVAGMIPAASEGLPLPAVALFGIPPEERAAIVDAIEANGSRPAVWRNPSALEQADVLRPVLVLIDLRHPHAHDAIRSLKAKGVRIVAAGPEVTDLTAPGIMALGAEEVVASSRLGARIDSLLPRII